MSKRRPPFWLRKSPPAHIDIAKLLPRTLGRGRRFETQPDVIHESQRSELLLLQAGASLTAEYLNDCRSGAYRCLKTYCPICAREFRRWFIGEVIACAETKASSHIVTVLLESIPRGALAAVDLGNHRALIRKRLKKTFSMHVPVIGGFEVVYQAKAKKWILHVNLLITDARKGQIAAFRAYWPQRRAVLAHPLRNLARQASYLLKYTTYHRPGKRTGPFRGRARPLNALDHRELVDWMQGFRFEDFIFLFGCRREGRRIRSL